MRHRTLVVPYEVCRGPFDVAADSSPEAALVEARELAAARLSALSVLTRPNDEIAHLIGETEQETG